jgi:hypothetical protein
MNEKLWDVLEQALRHKYLALREFEEHGHTHRFCHDRGVFGGLMNAIGMIDREFFSKTARPTVEKLEHDFKEGLHGLKDGLNAID